MVTEATSPSLHDQKSQQAISSSSHGYANISSTSPSRGHEATTSTSRVTQIIDDKHSGKISATVLREVFDTRTSTLIDRQRDIIKNHEDSGKANNEKLAKGNKNVCTLQRCSSILLPGAERVTSAPYQSTDSTSAIGNRLVRSFFRKLERSAGVLSPRSQRKIRSKMIHAKPHRYTKGLRAAGILRPPNFGSL